MNSNPPKVRLYGCGGTGISIVRECHSLNTSGQHPTVDFSYVDTSKSDVAETSVENRAFIIPGLDGQGQKRGADLDTIVPYIPSIMLENPPADLNIIVHSAGGGSGSVLGPLLTEEIFSRGHNVIAAVVGCPGTVSTLTNTIECIMSYVDRNQRLKTVIPIIWSDNNLGKSQSQVNQEIAFMVALQVIAFSGKNEKLDSADLKNWLNYSVVTDYPPEISMLRLYKEGDNVYEIASACSLLRIGQQQPELEVPYHVYGYMPEQVSKNIIQEKGSEPITMVMVPGAFDTIVASFKKKLAGMTERIRARQPSKLAVQPGKQVI